MQNFRIPTFGNFLLEKKGESYNNYINYIKKGEPLQHAALVSKEGDDIFDYVKNNIRRHFWMKPHETWKKEQNKRLPK